MTFINFVPDNLIILLIIIFFIIIFYLNNDENFSDECSTIPSGPCTSALCPSNCKPKKNNDGKCYCIN